MNVRNQTGFDTLCGMNKFKRRALAPRMLKLGATLLALAPCVLWAASPVPANLRVEWRVVSSSQARSQAESQAARSDAGGVSVSSAGMAQRQDSIHSVQVLNGSQARVYVGRTVPQTTWQFLYSGAAASNGANGSAQLLSQTNWIDLVQGLTVRPRWRGGSAPVEVEVEAQSRNHVGVMSGSSIARRSSFLLDRLEEQLFDSAITIMEDPLKLRGLRSRPFDGEGLPTAPRALVEKGRLTGWLMDSASARQLGLAPTGHASRGASGAPGVGTANVLLEPGSVSPAELIADITEGVLVTELIGHGVNGVTGDYSRGASGFRIVNGEIAGPVAEFTIAGNLIDMFKALVPASDLDIHRGIDVPTLRVDGMSVAGD